jgi:hypothetical protein
MGNDTADLLPMLSDLLEAKDRQLLNHCSRVIFTPPCANRTNLTVDEQKSLALGAFSMTSADRRRAVPFCRR